MDRELDKYLRTVKFRRERNWTFESTPVFETDLSFIKRAYIEMLGTTTGTGMITYEDGETSGYSRPSRRFGVGS